MQSANLPHLYKGIRLFLKILILLLCLWYIFEKVRNASTQIENRLQLNEQTIPPLVYLFLLMILNWGVEALKWKLAVAPLEKITFFQAFSGVLAGVSWSVFSPNRIGEFAPRVLLLSSADRLRATTLSLTSSFIQLCVTLLAGILAFVILEKSYADFFRLNEIRVAELFARPLLILLFLLFAVLFVLFRKLLFAQLRKIKSTLQLLDSSRKWKLILLSSIRYAVFVVQYVLVLQIFGIRAGITILVCLIALSFFVATVIPTVAFSEIAVRGAAATWCIGTISDDTPGIVAASVLLWLINLGIPAFVGSFMLGKMKLLSRKKNE